MKRILTNEGIAFSNLQPANKSYIEYVDYDANGFLAIPQARWKIALKSEPVVRNFRLGEIIVIDVKVSDNTNAQTNLTVISANPGLYYCSGPARLNG